MTEQPAIIRVTATDLGTGETDTVDLRPGMHVLICAEPTYVAHEQRYPLKGTTILTLKRRQPGSQASTSERAT